MYKMNTFLFYSILQMHKNGVEAIEYGGKIWVNQTHLQKSLVIQI